jgi:hypothetical protein
MADPERAVGLEEAFQPIGEYCCRFAAGAPDRESSPQLFGVGGEGYGPDLSLIKQA